MAQLVKAENGKTILIEIEFSVITDDPDDDKILFPLLKEFEFQHPVRVRLRAMQGYPE